MKTLVFSAALEEKVITPNTVIDCRGGKITFANHTFNDWKPFGVMTAQKILAYSSNVGTISIGEKLGRDKLFEYYKRFGLGSRTEVDFPGETSGLLWSPDRWSALTLPSMTIGYEVSVTAMQMVSAYACLANEGTMMVPRLVKEVRNDRDEIIKYFPAQIARQVVSRSTAQTIKEILRQTVQWGTGEKAAIPGYDVCGKTGTVRKFDKKMKCYSSQKILASFIGFAPFNQPEIVIGVFLDEPKKNAWGSSTAAPLFKRIAEQVLRYQNVRPTYLYTYDLDRLEPVVLAELLEGVPDTARVYPFSEKKGKYGVF